MLPKLGTSHSQLWSLPPRNVESRFPFTGTLADEQVRSCAAGARAMFHLEETEMQLPTKLLAATLSAGLVCFIAPTSAQEGCGYDDCPGGGSGDCEGVVIEIVDINCGGGTCEIRPEVSNNEEGPSQNTYTRDSSSQTEITLCNLEDCCVTIVPCVDWGDTDTNCCINIKCD